MSTVKKRDYSLSLLWLLVLSLFATKLLYAISDPTFLGDSAVRINSADSIAIRLEERLWLPFIQIHIFLLHKLKASYIFYKAIPSLYFLLTIAFLTKIIFRLIPSKSHAATLSMVLCLGLSFNTLVHILSTHLYQEILELAFFNILIFLGALKLKKGRIILLVAAAALLSRDSFWIYLFTITVLNLKRIIKDRDYIFSILLLWFVIFSWFSVTPLAMYLQEGRFPNFPLEWPLMILKEESAVTPGFRGFQSIWQALVDSKVVFPMFGVLIAFILKLIFGKKSKNVEYNKFYKSFFLFSVSSLTLMYLLVGFLDPYENTFGNTRIAIPMLSNLCIWIAILYRETLQYPKFIKKISFSILLISSLLLCDLNLKSIHKQHPGLRSYISTVEALKTELKDEKKLTACIAGTPYYEIMTNFIAPLIYLKKIYLEPDEFRSNAQSWYATCDLVVTPVDVSFRDKYLFPTVQEFMLKNQQYLILKKDTSE